MCYVTDCDTKYLKKKIFKNPSTHGFYHYEKKNKY